MSLAAPRGPQRQRTYTPPRFAKPGAGTPCESCAIGQHPGGFVPSRKTPTSPVLLVGEAPGFDEGVHGEPFVGAAGSMLTRVLKLIGKTREDHRIANVYSCVLPGGTSERQPWAYSARQSCTYLDQDLAESPTVVVPLGGVALKRVLDLFGLKDISVEDFHGTVTRDPSNRFWVVPSFHPSYLQRGAVNLMGVAAFDLQRAWHVAEHGWQADPAELVIDPPIDWFEAWAEMYIAAATQDPYAYPLANDIETHDKATDAGSMLASARDKSYEILRVNLCADPNLAITVPYVGRYIEVLKRVYAAQGVQYLWFKGFDRPRLEWNGMPLRRDRLLDCMWMAKTLQSDLPMGLGFWAPFYSNWGAWKHLSGSNEGLYGAVDGLQTRRVGDGMVADLHKEGMWHVFERHQHRFHDLVLQPATDVGVPIDRERLATFKAKLTTEAARVMETIQSHVPEALCPLTPKQGLTRPPLPDELHTKARTHTKKGVPKKDQPDQLKQQLFAKARVVERLVIREINICLSCGKAEVHAKHRCEDRGLIPLISHQPATVTRWFWQEPFNPDSSAQMLALLAAWKLQPGRNKQTGNDAVDRETLTKLLAKTRGKPEEPFFQAVLDYRSVVKVRSTYVVGTEKRLDENDRLHGEVTFKPSTMRTSMVAPNLQNVVADKGGKESLAAGFRYVVVARGAWEATDGTERVSILRTPPTEQVNFGEFPAVWSSAHIIEADYAGIEAVILGWCMRDPAYIRLAKLGMHAYVSSHALGRPADLTWSDQQLASYFAEIKNAEDRETKLTYDGCKRVVHGNGYGQTALGVYLAHQKLFKSQADADRIYRIYYALAPALPEFHLALRHTAHEQRFLGGPLPYQYLPAERKVIGHPYGYRHWFWSVVGYERLSESQRLWRLKRNLPMRDFNGIWWAETLGEDGKRVCALYPQGTARGVLTEACFPLFDPEDPRYDDLYIGDAYFGQTPLRAPIHDSLLLEVPTRKVDRVLERVFAAMEAPIPALPNDPAWGIGPYLTIGVDAKMGPDWGSMTKVKKHAAQPTTEVAADTVAEAADEEEADDLLDLETMMGTTEWGQHAARV